MQVLRKMDLMKEGFVYLDNHPEPITGRSEVKIRVLAASICGTDQGIYQSPKKQGIRDEMLIQYGGVLEKYQPITIGHEFCGEVVEVGSDVSPSVARVGDYVTSEMHINCGCCQQCLNGLGHICRHIKVKGLHLDGAFADYVVVPAHNLINLEKVGGRKVIPPRFGAFLDALGNSVYTVMEGNVAGKTVAILGCGAQGLMATAVARTLGATKIFVTDFSDPNGGEEAMFRLRRRLNTALEIGANACFDTNENNSPGQKTDFIKHAQDENGGGVDVVLEMSGAESAYTDAGRIVKNGGKILLLGLPSRPLQSFDIGKYAVWKGVTIQGIFGRRMFETWNSMLDLLAVDKTGLKTRLDKIIARDTISLADFERGFDMVRRQEAVKQLLVPDRKLKGVSADEL